MNDPAPEVRARKFVPSAPLPFAAACAILVALALPVLILKTPYDPNVLDFWIWYGTPVAIVTLIIAALPGEKLREIPARGARLLLRPSPLVFAMGVALIALTLILILQTNSFQRYTSTADEIAQLWHAKMMARGMLSVPVDPNPEFFAIDNLVDVGRWYSQYPIGGPAALVPGILIGAPWLVNPLLAALSVAGTYQFARTVYGELQGRVTGFIFAQSQTLLFMSATYLNHLPTLFCAVVLLIALAGWERAMTTRRRLAFAGLAGFSIGLVATLRPLDAICLTAATGAFQLYVIRADFKRLLDLVVQSVGGFLGAAPMLFANWRTSGNPLVFGYDMAWGPGHRIGFHMDPHGQMHTVARGAGYAARYVSELNFATMAWPIPLLAIVLAGLFAMKKTNRWDALLLGMVMAQLAGYAAYWGLGEFFGPRFLFTVLPAIVIFTARGPFMVAERFGQRAERAGLAMIAMCIALSWTVDHPASVRGFAQQVKMVRRGFRLDLPGAVREAGLRNAVVFVRESMSVRLLHRMWGVGMPRDESTQFLMHNDACTMLQGVREAEKDSVGTPERRAALLRQLSLPLPRNSPPVLSRDRNIRFASLASLTPECKKEIDGDAFVEAFYGPALLMNDLDAEGRISGDVIFVADLTDHNEVLRKRFGDRSWHRLVVSESKDRVLSAKIVPY